MEAARYQILEETPVPGGGVDRLVLLIERDEHARQWLGAPGSASRDSIPDPPEWARKLARIYHPGIPRVQSGARDGDRVVFTVPVYPVGGRLCDRREPIEAEELVRIVRSVAAALAKAHAAEVVHGDIREDQIFLCEDGRTLLLHVGLAPYLDLSAQPSDDVHALARLLHRGLVGRDVGSSGVLAEDLPPALPQGLRRFVSRSLSADPSRRISRAEEFAGDLGVILASWQESPRRQGPRRGSPRVWFGAMLAAGLAVLWIWLRK